MAQKVRIKSKSESLGNVSISSKGALAVSLSKLEGFIEPKVRVEQYTTDAEIAAEVLWNAKMKDDIGKVSVDLGCGTGILGIGLLLLGARKVIFVDDNENALKIAKKNLGRVKSESCMGGEGVFMCKDVGEFAKKADLVVQNPPFGVKVRYADRNFLEKAFEISNIVYSFHKSESKGFIEKFSTENGFSVANIWDFNFPLKATYDYHTRKIKRIKVSCFRMERVK